MGKRTENSINVSGNGTSILNNVKKSRVLINGNKKRDPNSGLFWTIAGVAIAAIALFIQTVTGWKDLPNFFK